MKEKIRRGETGRYPEGKQEGSGGETSNQRGGVAFVTISFQSSVTVSPPLETGNSSRMMSENENTEKRKKTGSKGRGNRK